MNNFHKIVLSISTVVLIISLCIVGYFLNNTLKNTDFPPIISECPDYWDISWLNIGDISKVICVNTGNKLGVLGTSNAYNINNPAEGLMYTRSMTGTDLSSCEGISMEIYPRDENGNFKLCENYNKARYCDIAWDGVHNHSNPCA